MGSYVADIYMASIFSPITRIFILGVFTVNIFLDISNIPIHGIRLCLNNSRYIISDILTGFIRGLGGSRGKQIKSKDAGTILLGLLTIIRVPIAIDLHPGPHSCQTLQNNLLIKFRTLRIFIPTIHFEKNVRFGVGTSFPNLKMRSTSGKKDSRPQLLTAQSF